MMKEETSSYNPPTPPEGPTAEEATATSAVTAVSHFLSWVLVPLLMPVYGTIMAFGLTLLAYTAPGTRWAFTGVVVVFDVVAPALIILLLKRLGFVHDVGLNDQKERLLPYIACVACMVGTALFMFYKGAPEWMVMFFFGGAAAGIVELIINRWWKISVHAAGIAGLVALLTRLYGFDYVADATFTWLIITIALAGLLGSARIWLGRHTLGQVLAGYAVGFCCVFFLM